MKKIFFVIICIAFYQHNFAQEPSDALRYSWYAQNGTARQQAIGGAMGSLGGEISSIFVNPAGLGFYRTGDFVLTPGFNFQNNKGTYFGRTEKAEKNIFSFGTSGFVVGSPYYQNKRRSSSFSIAINRTASFGNKILYRGQQSQNSYSQKFLEEIDNESVTDPNAVAQNFPFGTSLAFNTFWIDTANGWNSGNHEFVSLSQPLLAGGGLLQENSITNKGGITELALGGATNYNDKFLFGAAIAIPFLHYEREGSFTEADATTDANNNFDFAVFSENLTTDGVGINLKAGIIYKPAEFIRLGLALHSPTYYVLTDKYNASVTTNTENYQGQLTQSSGLFTNGADAEFKYVLLTPYRVIASVSYVLREIEDVRKQKGFLTADIEFVNYKASSFHTHESSNDQATKNYLKSLNNAIDNAYKGAINFRVGGELKFTTIMVRLGGAYYSNPYKNINGEKGSKLLLSGGLGYRNKGVFVDLTYVHAINKDVHFPYRLQSAPFSGASIKGTNGNVVLTVGFKI